MLNKEQCIGFVNKAGYVYRYVSLDAVIKAREDALKYVNFDYKEI